jgi:hypothetical protein
MGNLGVEIDQEKKEELFEMAERHFPSSKEFRSSIGISKSNFNSHRNGDSQVLGLDVLYNLVKTVNTSQPIFQESEPEQFKQGSRGDSVEVEDSVQELALGYFETEELQQIFDKSVSQVKKYRNNANKYVPEEGFENAFEEMGEELDSSISLSVDIVDIESNNSGLTDSGVLAQSWDENDIIENVERLEYLERLLEEKPGLTGRASQGIPAIERMKKRNYSKAFDRHEGDLYSLLSDSGHLEQWGGGARPTYKTTATDDELNLLKNIVEAYSERDVIGSYNEEDKRRTISQYSDEDLVDAVNKAAEKLGRTPNRSQVENLTGITSSPLTRNGGYNNLLFRAGEDPNWEKYGEDELVDLLSQIYVEKDFTAPRPTDVDKSDRGPKSQAYKRRFGSWDEALQEADIPSPHYDFDEGSYFESPGLGDQETVHLPREDRVESD